MIGLNGLPIEFRSIADSYGLPAQVCSDCGALVWATADHLLWHQRVTGRTEWSVPFGEGSVKR